MISNLRATLTMLSLSMVFGAALPAGAVVTHFNDGAVHDVTGAFTDRVSVNDGGAPSQGTIVNMLAGSSVVASSSVAVNVSGHSTVNFFAGSSIFTPDSSFTESIQASDFSTVNLFGGTLNGDAGIDLFGNVTLNMYGGTIISRSSFAPGVTAGSNAVVNLYGGEIDGTQSALENAIPSGRINLFGGVIFGNSRVFNARGGTIYIYGKDFSLDGTPVPYGLITKPNLFDDQLTGTLSDGSSLNVLLKGADFVLVPMAPAPEPATALLSGVALAGLGMQMLRGAAAAIDGLEALIAEWGQGCPS